MRPPLIGITCGTSARDTRASNPQDRLNQSYSRAVAAVGGIPVILPNAGAPDDARVLLDRLDAVLLSGGYDVAPDRFGEEMLNETVEVDPERDQAELDLIYTVLDRDMPVLAICRGIQLLNVAMGGSLIQDIPSQVDTSLCHSQKAERSLATHPVRVEPGSKLGEIVGRETLDVNSFHHQAVKRVAEGLVVTAAAPDGIVEAVEAAGARFVVAVQWHPEEMVEKDDAAKRIFTAFVRAASGP
jgi:putative glutamine amidotransferase